MSEQKQVPIISPNGDTKYVDFKEMSKILQYANLAQIRLRNLEQQRETNPKYYKYTKDQIVTYLGNPANYEKQLRNMSIYLFNIQNYYRRLIQYLAYMSTYSYIVVPYGIDHQKQINQNKFKKGYYTVLQTLERMNIRHEFGKALTIAFRDDVFYGYAWETNDSFTFQKLDPDYCKISSVEDGVYNFAFDFSYFQTNQDKLPNFPPEFETMYNLYKTNTQVYRWQELDQSKQICLKVNEQDYIPVPPFVQLFSALADIEDYRAISKNASETNNYKALALQIPINEQDGSFLIDYDLCKDFYDMLCNVLPENIGAFMAPMKVSQWDFEKSGAISTTNDVANAEATMWSQAGVNKILFGGGEDPSASTLKLCMINDQAIVFNMMRQIERWINRKLKQVQTAYKFKINILDVTVYNRDEMHQQYLKDGQYGLPVRSAIMATEGYSPSDTENMAYLENTILNLSTNEVPLVSSNVQSTENESGRPQNESNGQGLSEAGNTQQDDRG